MTNRRTGAARRSLSAALLTLCWLVLPLSHNAGAQEPAPPPPATGLTTPEDLEAFIDGVMAAHMPSRHIPTAAVSVVQAGELFFAKGYGYADREKRTPVDPERTLFRPGSISKLFTWTAVMQLVERGQLDPDADVNDYLTGFKIPATYPQPITMKHLMTHTPGFEDGGLGYLFVKSADEIKPLGESLAAHVPARVRPPGTWSSYSNYGTALAGLIVANVSGLPFNEYVEKNIFTPLGMEHSTFREPLPEHLAPDMAVGYAREAGLYQPKGFEFISNFGPAGALSSTATDMARFMIAHLQLGRYGEARILEEETARRMHSQLYTLDPRLPGMAHGFYESEVHGHHVIGHGGDTFYFHSNLVLLPDKDVGLYVSYVTNGSRARIELADAFVERYFPLPEPPAPEPPEDFAERGERFTGSYWFTRHNYTTIEKLMALPSALEVALTAEKTLKITGLGEEPLYWVETGPLYFRQVDGPLTVAFKENDQGEITHLFFGLLPFMPAYRIAWYETPGFNYTVLGLGGLLFVTTLVSAFRHRKKSRQAPSGARWAMRLAAAISFLTLAFAISFVAILAGAGVDVYYGVPASLTAALVLPIVTSVLTLGVPVFLVLAWKNKYWTLGRRLHYTLFAMLALGFVWFYQFWNVLGFRY